HEAPLRIATAGDVLYDRVREADVERPVGEGQVAPVGPHRGDRREGGREAVERRLPDCGHALGPGVKRLEEVVRRTAAERGVGDADVDHGRLGPRAKELEEEPRLAFAAPQRDARRDPRQHRLTVYLDSAG